MIEIKQTKANLSDILVANNFQKPNTAIENYWDGTEEELYLFYKKHNIDYNFSFENTEQLHEKSQNYLTQVMEAVRRDISLFDFRLRESLNPSRLLISSDDYMKLELDISDENNQELINNFISAKSRSFIDFRVFDENKLTLIYNRKGMYDSGDRIAVLKSKESITLRDNFKEAKDNNFILSGFLKELVKNDVDCEFVYNYMAGDSPRQMKISTKDINVDTQTVEEKNRTALKDEQIKEIAIQELKEEKQVNRQSLSPDSNNTLITKEGTTEIRVNTKTLDKVENINDAQKIINSSSDESVRDYIKKEQEKLKIKLEKAEKDARVVYEELKIKINEGISVQDSLDMVKQKYREEHTINLASMYLTKDLLRVGALENIIVKKDEQIESAKNTILEKENSITKREETISSLKATLQTKENELRLSVENHKKDIEILTIESKKAIDEITIESESKIKELKTESESTIKELKTELKNDDEIITRLTEQKNIYEKDISRLEQNLKNKDDEIINLKATLQTNKMSEKVVDFLKKAEVIQDQNKSTQPQSSVADILNRDVKPQHNR